MNTDVQHPPLPAGIDPATVVRGDFGPTDHPILGADDHAAQWLGMRIKEYGEGYVRAEMTVRHEMLNGFAMAHGGMVFAFADTCFAWAANNPDGDGDTISVTQGADVNFMSSPGKGSVLTAVGVRHTVAGRSGLCDVTVTDQNDKVVAQFRGRYRTIPRG